MAVSIPRRPETQGESPNSSCFPSGEAVAPRGSRLSGAAAPRGLMARARPELRRPGLGAGRRQPPRARGGASRQLPSCFLQPSPPVLSWGRAPRSRDSAPSRAGGWGAPSSTVRQKAASVLVQAQARLPPAGAGGHFLFRPNFADCQPPGMVHAPLSLSSASSPQDAAGERVVKRCAARFPGRCPGDTLACPGVGAARRNEGGGRELGPTPASQRQRHAHTRAYPFRPRPASRTGLAEPAPRLAVVWMEPGFCYGTRF